MKPSDICPMCEKVNENEWCIWPHEGKSVKTCKLCLDQYKSGIDGAFYEKSKRKQEEDRRRKNAEVIRMLRAGTLPRAPGNR